MKPEASSQTLMGITRARAKMHEYGVRPEDYNEITRNPAGLFSLVIGMLGDVAVSISADLQTNEDLQETKSNLLFCARFFDSYLESRLDTQLDPYLVLLAGSTYYLADIPGSASVMAGLLPSPCPDLGARGLEELLAWILRGDFSAPYFLADDENVFLGQIGDQIRTFFTHGRSERDILASLTAIRQKAYHVGSPRELLLADLISALVRKRISNSTWATLPRYSQVSSDTWATVLQKPTFIRELWPAQRLLGEEGLYRGLSAVVQMPTSAGKTKSLDLVIRAAFYSNRTSLVIVVAPFRALCEEIRQSLLIAFAGEGISVDELTDVAQEDFDLEEFLSRRQVLVMTPEKCLYVLRHNPDVTETLGLLIFDEGHQFDSNRRGVTYELLITSLKMAVARTTQIVLVSAVLKNAQTIANWLIGANGLVISGNDLLPTARSLAFASWKTRLGRLEFFDSKNPETFEFFCRE